MDNKNLSIENYNKLKEEQDITNPLQYQANVGLGLNSLSDKSKKELAYLGKSAKAGLVKGLDLATAVDEAIQKVENPITIDSAFKDTAKNIVEERDAFYLSNKDDISGGTQFLGGMVEQIANPIEFGVNAIETYVTGGSNIWYKLGKTALYNGATTVGLENIYSKRYNDEYLSADENIKIGLQSAILSSAMVGIGEIKGRILAEKNIAGDVNINVRQEMDNYNDVYTYKGDNAQKMYTNYESQYTAQDPYIFHDFSEIDIRKVIMHPSENVGISIDTPYYRYGQAALESSSYIDQIHIQDIFEQGMANSRLKQMQGTSTVLSRRFDEIETLEKVGNYIVENDLSDNFAKSLNNHGVVVPKNFAKKDAINQNVVLQNKSNTTIDDLINDVMPTIQYTYENVKTKWKTDPTAQPTITSYNQIDIALNRMDAKYQTQKLYVQNEYLNIINGKDGNMSVEDYIKSVGKDKQTIAEAWVTNKGKGVEGDKNNFLEVAYQDSVKLDELNMKTSLYDIDDFKEFHSKFGKHFDENGNIIFNDDLLDTIAKLDKNSDDYNTLVAAMKDNSNEWLDFITASKDKLEGHFTAQEIKKLEKEGNKIIHKMNSDKQVLEHKINLTQKEYKKLLKSIEEMEKNELTDTYDYTTLVRTKNMYIKQIQDLNEELNQWYKTTYKEYVDRLAEIDAYKSTHTNVQVHDKILANRLKKNQEFIEKEYANTLSGVNIKNKEPKIWKKEVADKIAKRKKELAEESIKINQVVNKKNLLGGAQEYFTESVYTDNLNNVKLKPEKVADFIEQVIPFYKDGTIKLPKGLTTDMDLTNPTNLNLIADNFKELVANIKLTRQSTKVVGEYKTIGELRDYFGDGERSMSNFFLNFRDKAYIKTNAEIVRDIFDKNTAQTARYIAYGSTSPFTMRNKLQQIGNTAKKLNPHLSDTEKSMISNFVGQRGVNMLNHKHKLVSTPQDLTRKVNGVAQKLITTKYLVGTGFEELTGQNIAIALYRGQKFGGAKVYVNTAQFQAMKMAKHTSAVDSGNLGKYTLGKLRHSVDMKQATDKLWDKYIDIGLMGQKMSDNQLKSIADVVSTATLDRLPTNYNKLTNEMKSLLRVNGIEEHNYKYFTNFTKGHITDNGNYININQLVEMINDNKYNEYADALRNVYYSLTDYIGDVKSHTKFDNVKLDAFTSWGNMFRSFSRAMNRDTLTRFMYATNSEGVGVTRLTQFKTDKASSISDTASGLLVGTMALGIGGMARDVSKEIIRSSRTMLQRMGVIETKIDTVLESGILENIWTLMYSGSVEEIANEFTSSGSSIIGSEVKQIKKIWDTFTDEEKKAFGTNNEEGIKELSLYLMSFTGKPIINNIQGLMKDDIYDLEKVYGFTKEQQERYESHVRAYIYKNQEQYKKDIKSNIENTKKQIQAEIDYMEGNNNSFNLLPNEDKTVIETIVRNSNAEDKDDLRQEATVLITQGGTKEDIVESLSTSRPMDDIQVDNTIKELNQIEDVKEMNYTNIYNTYSAKRKKLFQDIMKVKGKKEITDDDYKMFVEMFERKGSMKLNDILNIYNIKHEDLIKIK